MHGGVVADDVRRHALALHDEGEQREHQPEGEAEDGDGGDRRQQVDDALPIHGAAPRTSLPRQISKAREQDDVEEGERHRHGVDAEEVDGEPRDGRADEAAHTPHGGDRRRARDQVRPVEAVAQRGERHHIDAEGRCREQHHHRPHQPVGDDDDEAERQQNGEAGRQQHDALPRPVVGQPADGIEQHHVADDAEAQDPARGLELEAVADAVDGEEGDQHIVEQRCRADREEQHRRLPDEGEEAAAFLLRGRRHPPP